MAEAAVIDPIPCERSYRNEAFDADFAGNLDLLQFPDVPADMNIPLGFAADLDLDFEGDLDFSVADLLDFTDIDDDIPADGAAPLSSSASESKEACGISSSSSVSEHAGDEISERTRNLNAQSPDSGDSTTCHADFRDSSSVKLEEDDEKKGWSMKRKKSTEEGEISYANIDSTSRSSKYRRSGSSDPGTSSCLFSAGNEDDEKRKARLMRNRESAQLSRQRKKHYVEELEEKVKSMNSTITELNRKISFIMAENSSLRQQLNGGGTNSGNCPRPAVYPTPLPMHFPWIPYSGYPSRPQGAQIPLVPIPRLKQQQTTSAPKPRRSENRKSETKTKKLASVSILGLLFCMLFIGVFVPGPNYTSNGRRDMVWNNHPKGRVLTVGGNLDQQRNIQSKEKSPHNASDFSGNSSKPLLASLYVPRNDKLVKIDGNLIIQSVLASERAVSRSSNGEEQSDKEIKETTSLAIAGTLDLALPVSESERGMERNALLYRSIAEYQRSRGYRSKDRSKQAPADAPAKEWFQEDLEGPILSSGMCTEVFSFEVASSATGNGGGVVPAASSSNSSHISKTKNRRALHAHPQAIPLPASPPPNGTDAAASPPSMVVSVLVDPREVNDGVLSSKSISRVFVVVLLDSIKYVTYSCVLPFKNHHL